MEITTIHALRQEDSSCYQFEVELSDGTVLYLYSAELLNYRKVQEFILRHTGCVFTHGPAEKRGGRQAWQEHVTALMGPAVVIPAEEDAWNGKRPIYDIVRWRKRHRDAPEEVAS